MKSIKITILTVLSVLLFTYSSCSDSDGYSLGDMWESKVTIVGNENKYSLIRDDGKRMWIAASNIPAYIPTTKRAIVNYTILGESTSSDYDYIIKLNGMKNLVTNDFLYTDKANIDIQPDDLVEFQKMWIAGDFFNMQLRYGTDANGRVHNFNMYYTSPSQTGNVSQDDTVRLYLKHDSNEQIGKWLKDEIVCYKLSSLDFSVAAPSAVDTVVLKIEMNTSNGKIFKTIKHGLF